MPALRPFISLTLVAFLVPKITAQKVAGENPSFNESSIQTARTSEKNGVKLFILSRTPYVPNQPSVDLASRVGNMGQAIGGPLPTIYQPLMPDSIPPGSAGFTLIVNGSGFVASSVVNWNGTALPTNFINQNQLTAAVPATDVIFDGTISVTVITSGSGKTSNTVPFMVTVPTDGLTFSNSTISVGLNPGNVVVADFNNDGKLDMAVVNRDQPDPACYSSGAGGTVSILLGNGDGTFSTGPTLCFPDSLDDVGGSPMAVGDFNGDGNQDLVVSTFDVTHFGWSEQLFLGNGDGTFTLGSGFSIFKTDALGPITVGDFNGDGSQDLAFPYMDDFGFWNVAVLSGSGSGFGGGSSLNMCGGFPGCPISRAVAGDFNGDGNLDLAVFATVDGNPALSIVLGNGNGTFTLAPQQPSGIGAGSVVGDFDGDGKLDLAGGSTFLHGNGDGTFTPSTEPSQYSVGGIAAADFNGDGRLDLVSPGVIFLGNGDGTFQSGLTQTNSNGTALATGDFNGDGRIDIVTANSADNTISVLVQAPLATLSSTTLSFGSQGVGTTSPAQQMSISNTGSAPLAISVISAGANSNDFAVTPCVLPAKVEPGASCNVQVTFTPGNIGLQTAALVISDSAGNSPQNVSLSGTGVSRTATSLRSSSNPSRFGQAVTFIATITPQFPAQATGAVIFKDGKTTLGTSPVSNNTSSLTTSTLKEGTHSITAAYSGDTDFTGSISATLSQLVQSGTVVATTIALTSSVNPSATGKPVTLTATVSAQSGGGIPTGTVTFENGSTALATVNLRNGIAKYTTTTLPPGSNNISAIYGGDVSDSGSTSASVDQFEVIPTRITLISTPNPSAEGQLVTFTASVTSIVGAPPDGESVNFKRGTTVLGTGQLSGGNASFSTSSLGSGTEVITATYGGDSNFATSTSKSIRQTISRAVTMTTLISAQSPSSFGQSVTFTATVAPQFGGTPSGTVTFKSGNAKLGTLSLVGGVASYTTAKLPVGTESITAVFNGNSSFMTSTSNVLTQVVNPASTTTTLASSVNPSNYKQVVTFTTTLTAQTGGTNFGSSAASLTQIVQ